MIIPPHLVPQCQNVLEDGETRCPNKATHTVSGLPGNPWIGYHCIPHTQAAVTMFNHQGGCVVMVITP